MSPALPDLIVITDWSLPRGELLSRIESLEGFGGQVAVQYRHPGVPVLQALQEARVLARICARLGMALFVNGRLDVALRVGAHLHLPSRGLRAGEVRPVLPPDRWISAAAHDAIELEDAAGADLVLLSPVFRPLSKSDTRPTLGVSGLEALAARTRARPYALGGIGADNAGSVPARFGLAAIGSVLHARDARQAVEALLGTRHAEPLQRL